MSERQTLASPSNAASTHRCGDACVTEILRCNSIDGATRAREEITPYVSPDVRMFSASTEERCVISHHNMGDRYFGHRLSIMREQTAVLCTKSLTKSKPATSRPIFTDQIKAHRTAPRLPPRRAIRANPGAHSCHDRGVRRHPSSLSPPTLTHLEPISLLDAPGTHNTPDPTRDRDPRSRPRSTRGHRLAASTHPSYAEIAGRC